MDFEIKDTIEALSTQWNWHSIKNSPHKRQLLGRLEGKKRGLKVNVPRPYSDFMQEFTFRHEQINTDVRIWTKTPTGLLQWRTGPKTGSRLVYKNFSAVDTERIDIEDVFLDTSCVTAEEIELFCFLYADISAIVPLFWKALAQADKELGEYKRREDERHTSKR